MTAIPYGWAVGVTDEMCIASPTDPNRMLCRRWRDFVPTVPPVHPPRVHDECRRLWDAMPHEPGPVELGTCPECWGEVPVEGGAVVAHPALVQTSSGPQFTGPACDGAGLTPLVDGAEQ